MRLATLICLSLLAGCAEAPAERPSASSDDVPSVLRIVCYDDGSTELLNTEVRTSPDGAHLEVDNRAGETVSINGAGLDFSKGVTTQAARVPPGQLKIACWPGSMHRGPEPKRKAITIEDPDGHWVKAELECPRDELVASSTLDYGSFEEGERGDPEDIARRKLQGLEPDDDIFTVGYPEAEYREVAVERNGENIAIASFSPTKDGGWLLGSYSACDSAEINY